MLRRLVAEKARSAREAVTMAGALVEKYGYLIQEGWHPTEDEIARDVALLFGGEFERFLAQ